MNNHERRRSNRSIWIVIALSAIISIYTVASAARLNIMDAAKKTKDENKNINMITGYDETKITITATTDRNNYSTKRSKDNPVTASTIAVDNMLMSHLKDAKIKFEQLNKENERLRKENQMLRSAVTASAADNNAGIKTDEQAEMVKTRAWSVFSSNPHFSLHLVQDPSMWYDMKEILSADEFSCPKKELRVSEPFVARKDIESLLRSRNHTNPVNIQQQGPKAWIYFHHVRKAAGSWFCKTAKINLGYDWMQDRANRCKLNDEDRVNKVKPGVYSSFDPDELYSMVKKSGSLILAPQWDVMKEDRFELKQNGAVFITILRDPIQRLVSQAMYEFNVDGIYNLTKHSQKRNDNFLVRSFAGMANPPFEAQPVRLRHFEKAKRVLMEFDLVLIFEYLSDGIKALKQRLHWKHVNITTKVNTSKVNKNQLLKHVKPSTMQALMVDNIWDIMLYNWAKRVFFERYACEGPSLALK